MSKTIKEKYDIKDSKINLKKRGRKKKTITAYDSFMAIMAVGAAIKIMPLIQSFLMNAHQM